MMAIYGLLAYTYITLSGTEEHTWIVIPIHALSYSAI